MRNDITDILIHFTKSTDRLSARENLCQILKDMLLLGGSGFNRSHQKCVCFSEAPLLALTERGLVNSRGNGRYEEYGLAFSKRFIFALGGRPVIYQPETEYSDLPRHLQWRHVRFDLEENIDFTWEREWRVPCHELHFQPGDVEVIVPDEHEKNRLTGEFEGMSFYEAYAYTVVLGDIAMMYHQPSPWKVTTLRQN